MFSSQQLDQLKTVVGETVGQKTQGLTADIQGMKKDLKTLQSGQAKMHHDLKTVINFFDREVLELRGRVERIEKQLGITSWP